MLLPTLSASALLLGTARAEGALALDRPAGLDRLQALELPDQSRPEIPEDVPVAGPWRVVYTIRGVRTWEAPLPIRSRALFFSRPPGDMALRKGRRDVIYAGGLEGHARADSWAFTSHSIQIRRPIAAGPPGEGEYTLRYGEALTRERSLNLSARGGASDREFLVRSLQLDDTTRRGLFLPAPAAATYTVDVPPGGALAISPLLLPPEAADPAGGSDGAVLEIAIGDEVIASFDLEIARIRHEKVDLSRWGGRSVALTLRTDPKGSPHLDYVLVADPVVYVPQGEPPRAAIIFVDTLRADHLSLYGYERATTPRLDAWAEGAAVFEQARTIAPWTLPSARTMLTGDVPERWGSAATLQARLADAGWSTAFIVGNIYLSSNFEMADGWSEHRCVNWPRASVQVDRALAFLERHDDRPAFVMLHLMDMHLPYKEPFSYRYLFAGDAPDSLPGYSFQRTDVVKTGGRELGKEGKQYVRDRYDNNLRYVDDQIARFIEALPPGTPIIVLSDHGEEFWEHGGFEHGHTLYDELLHVPLVVSAPGIAPGRYSEPVSLLDVAPTLLQALGLPAPDASATDGWPLQDLAGGGRAAEFGVRSQAFGRPLYGTSTWGSLEGSRKYTTREGRERIFDVAADPGETRDVTGGDNLAGRAALSAALQVPVKPVWRLTAGRAQGGGDTVAVLTVPGGVEAAWDADDPTQSSKAKVEVEGETVTITWFGGYKNTREVFVSPRNPDLQAATLELKMRIEVGGDTEEGRPVPGPWPPPLEGQRGATFMRASVRNRNVSVGYAVSPLPIEGAKELDGTDIENCLALKALGYVEDCP